MDSTNSDLGVINNSRKEFVILGRKQDNREPRKNLRKVMDTYDQNVYSCVKLPKNKDKRQ